MSTSGLHRRHSTHAPALVFGPFSARAHHLRSLLLRCSSKNIALHRYFSFKSSTPLCTRLPRAGLKKSRALHLSRKPKNCEADSAAWSDPTPQGFSRQPRLGDVHAIQPITGFPRGRLPGQHASRHPVGLRSSASREIRHPRGRLSRARSVA